MKAIAYCRVSTVGQGEDGVSLAMQKDRITAWCLGNGYELDAVFVEAMSERKGDWDFWNCQRAARLAMRNLDG